MNGTARKQEAYIYEMKGIRKMPEEAKTFLDVIDKLLDNEEISEAEYEEFFAHHVRQNYEKKIEYTVAKMRDNNDTIAALKSEREHISARIKLFENDNNRLKNIIGWWLRKLGLKKLKTTLETVYVRKSPGGGLIMPDGYDANKIGACYYGDSPVMDAILVKHQELYRELSKEKVIEGHDIYVIDKRKLAKYMKENPEKVKGSPLVGIMFTEGHESLVIRGL